MSDARNPEPDHASRQTIVRLWTDAEGEGYSALSQDMVAYVRGWSLLGIILFFWGCVGLAIAGILHFVWSSLGLLWLNIPVLTGGLWMWRQQFVPFRTGPVPLVGKAARRFATRLCATALAVDAVAMLEVWYRQDGIRWLLGLLGFQ